MKKTDKEKSKIDLAAEQEALRAPAWTQWALNIGLLLIMTGTVVPLFTVSRPPMWDKILFAVGCAGVLVARLFAPYSGKVLRIKRLKRIESWTAIIFCVGAFFMFTGTRWGIGANDWLAFTMAGAFLTAFTSIMIPRALKKSL